MDKLPKLLSNTLRTSRVKHFPKGQIILYEGDPLPEVFIIKSGAVKLYDIDSQGNEKVLHIAAYPAVIPFAFFSGEDSIIRWFYSALTDCDLYVLDYEKLRELMFSDSGSAQFLVNNFSRDVHELLIRLSSLGKTVVHDKIITALNFLVNYHTKPLQNGWWRVLFAINHQLLADMAGVTRESTALVMKDLQDKKIIRSPQQTILEINKDKLLEVIGE
jgi:CRP/FNR family transcriptional regulator